MRVLGIETTCDETAAAVVRLRPDGAGEILADEVMSQIAAHARLWRRRAGDRRARACRDHRQPGRPRAAPRRGAPRSDLDGVAAAAGPGLIGGVLVGLMTGKGIALAAGKPFIAVNHLEAHALVARLSGRLAFPYLLLLASGGHTQILAVKGVGDYDRLGATMDDAIGEAFDKTAKMLGLPYPGGPAVEAAARDGDPDALRPAAPDARPAERRFLALGAEDRDAPRGPIGRAAAPARRRRSLRFVPGRGRRRDRGPHARRPQAVSPARRRRAAASSSPAASPPTGRSARRWRAFAPQAGLPLVAPPQKPVHRQRRDDRLGGHRAPAARAWSTISRARPAALAARPESPSERSTARRERPGGVSWPFGLRAGSARAAGAAAAPLRPSSSSLAR